MMSKIQNIRLLDDPFVLEVSSLLYFTFKDWEDSRTGSYGFDSFTSLNEHVLVYGVINEERFGLVRPCTLAMVRNNICVIPFIDLTSAVWAQ